MATLRSPSPQRPSGSTSWIFWEHSDEMTGNILARQWHPRLGTSTDEAIRIPILIVALEVGSITQSHVTTAGLSVFAGIWKNWCDPLTGKWERTFAVAPCRPTSWSRRSMIACSRCCERSVCALAKRRSGSPRAAGAISRSPARRFAATIATLVASRHGLGPACPGDSGRTARALETLPIMHKQGRRPIQAAIVTARAAIRL
jgi:hypothetical protein